jgi:alkaline phosphatase D
MTSQHHKKSDRLLPDPVIRSLTALFMAAGLIFLSSCAPKKKAFFRSSRPNDVQRTWVGPDFWANRLQDWQLNEGRLECLVSDAAKPYRTVHLLTRAVAEETGDLTMRVKIGLLPSPQSADEAAAGFLIASGPDLDYRAAALIHHSPGPGAGLFAGIDGLGRLFIKDMSKGGDILIADQREEEWQEIELQIVLSSDRSGWALSLSSHLASDGSQIKKISRESPEAASFKGSLALVSHPGTEGNTARFWFKDWEVEGSLLKSYPDRNCGPILSTQYTLSDGRLNLTAQLLPIGERDNRGVTLEIKEQGRWKAVAETEVTAPGWTASFRLDTWDDSRDVPFRVCYDLKQGPAGRSFTREGTIRHNPLDQEVFTVAAFTGNHNAQAGVDRRTFPWDKGLWFPHADIIRHVRQQNPDFLFFSGDQVYEGGSPTAADFNHPILDYLYKWYLWCWAFRELTADIPAVAVPDDHDVFHGNLWGAGGRATTSGTSGAEAQDSGGYKLSPDFVNMVERTQTSNLPPPHDPTKVEQGIGVYYCAINYGGISFAVIEDRKFKSAPKALLPKAEVWNGWPQNEHFDPKTEADVPGAVLLGERQLSFLEDWASDWSNGIWMKAVLSQTLFSNVATLPEGAKSGSIIPSLPYLGADDYAENDRPVADMDSNGWPQSGRDRAIRAMRKGFAVHICGDQHLGSTIRYGLDQWRDSGFAICVPSVANFWPRRWYPSRPGKNPPPGSPRYTGDFEDGFGNKITVLAVSNPTRTDREPQRLHQRAPGYGIVRFHRATREIVLENWPRWASPLTDKPYPGWPVRTFQKDNYARTPAGYLPAITVVGLENPVFQVVDQAGGEIIYTIRSKTSRFTPMVFEEGTYTVRVGEPGTDSFRSLANLSPTKKANQTEITISFDDPSGGSSEDRAGEKSGISL